MQWKFFFFFQRKKTTQDVLEKLEKVSIINFIPFSKCFNRCLICTHSVLILKDITNIEKYRTNTEQRQRRIVGQLVVYSVGAYVLAAAIFYFYWFPSTLREQFICILPLLLFPIL